eukprot:TRINITY_DN18733_c0_g1_i1.p1 TRINITY_DN18733_c0_g1~~TRINITY_DN18733_c0_g1_i1.p1  ORF type:complete len:271 (-),score=34.84 TRINITY_DN18733_c0_g1_i1:407-1219(-)
MDGGYTSLPTSHLLGSVPAVIGEESKISSYEVPIANLQTFPPTTGGDIGRGYQSPGSPFGADEQPTTSWKGVFSISSYSPYFNVDTDDVLERIMSSFYPTRGNFFRKIEANPDLYGPVWISTTLVFMLAALGNCATYLMHKQSDKTTVWNFDVSYINWAACVVYGYMLVVPTAVYFWLQFQDNGSNVNLIRLWCMWGYSLFTFIIVSFLLIVPTELFRWIIILLAGSASACFVALNILSYGEGLDRTMVAVCSLVLQMALAIFIKTFFYA